MSRWLGKIGKFGRYLLMAFLLLALLASAGLWYVTTNSFQQLVRRRLVAAIEHASGGRAELGSFHVVPFRFQVEVRNLTLHGREGSGELPLAHVDSVSAVVNLSSILGARIGFHSVTLDHPIVHLILYPDGSTNRPGPTGGVSDFAHLFAISIDRLEVRHGELLLQDRKLPLDFVSNNILANLDYSFLHRRYSGNASVGRAETRFDGYRPVDWAGQVAFSIDSTGVQVQALTATAGSSKLLARGAVTDLRNPVFKGSYDLLVNLQQAAAIARQPQITSGTLEFQGTGAWSQATFSANGDFDLRDSDWQNREFSVRNIFASGKYAVDPRKIQMTRVEGRLWHGSFSGDAEADDWRAPAERKFRSAPELHGSVKVKASGISVGELLAGLGQQFRPIKELRLAGDASGTAEARWRDSWRNAEINSTFAVAAPNRELPGQMPITASGGLRYQSSAGILELNDFSASTPATQIRASGPLNSSAALRVSFETTNIAEWRPVISALVPEGLPVAVRGRATFNGNLNGIIPDVTLAGRLQLQDFDTSLPKKAAAQAVHWDSLNADLRVSSKQLNVHDAEAHSGDMMVALNGETGLVDWKPAATSSFQLHLDAQNVEASELQAIVAPDTDLQGRLELHLNASVTIGHPEGSGSLSWSQGLVNGYAFDNAKADVSLQGREAAIKRLDVTRGAAHILGRGAYDVTDKSFHLALTGNNFDLAEFPQLERSRIKVGGTLDFSADVAGTRANPDIDTHLHVRDLTFNGERAGNYMLDAVTNGQALRVTGQSDFKTAQLDISGNVVMRDLWPAQINFHFARLDVDAFIQSYLNGHITGHSSVAGDLAVQGMLLDPQHLTVTGNLTELKAEVEQVKLHNQGPVQFSVSDETAKITSLHIVGTDTDLSASGSMQLTGERNLDVQGNGQIGLKLVESYDPDLSGSGTVKIEGNITGTVSAPRVKGTLEIENGSLADINLPSALSAINGTLLFNQNQVTIENLKAQTGGGNLSLSGHAEVVGRQVNFDLDARADAVRLRYPPGVSSTATAALRWSGNTRGSVLSGDVTVTKLSVTPGFDFGSYLEKAVQQASLPQTDPVLNKIRLDLHVVTTPELQMQTSVLRVRGDADLRVRGNAAKPVLLGRAEIFEGDAYFNGTKYRLERGGVTFGTATANNTAATVPYVDFEATTRVQDYDITLSINGPADRPKLTYRSEPPLPTNDIIGLLAFGGTTEQSAQLQQNNQSAFSQQASNAMLAAALNATLNNRTQKLFGNSRIKIDPQGLETETSPTQSGPAVTIEQQVKDNLTLTYTTNVSQTSQQVIRAEYNLTRNISIVAIRDQTGVISFDVKVRRRKR